MMDEETICPYTGLRSFSEEESLYFKGRDEHIIRVIEQLEQKKFLMVTGASGDGKSSLIFAGLIPQARAGFFKATYSNWSITSFRPERSPLRNMSKALAEALRLEDHIVENELGHGFSSLTEIYKSSSLYIDQQGQSSLELSPEKNQKEEREAGNLLIIVDQFEEFFTNPENFSNGVPSQDSRLVLNVLLETIKISLREDLPIYVVFTMRSDYIGQCAAFRGLPEFIGFSQFFVPRLQRKELQQVIEEPAILSGIQISKRLIDRLIYDLEDAEDHLPILQHALKEIWKAADQGKEKMDLIHYAMVGGMPGEKLPKEDFERFQKWEQALPSSQQAFLNTPDLSNVLDIHATRLYQEAASIYNNEHEQKISDKDAKLIIAITFACLTRIDENRAVRNRMTLEEITRIINVPTITYKIVDDVLRPFRNPEHTLVRPFIAEESKVDPLPPDTVLDITHEALIRNWKLLNRWAAKEFEYYNTFIDFKKQLQRWIDNGKSGDYLLPIGPLTYFEDWVEKCRPNAYWINRYNQDTGETHEKIQKSQQILSYTKEFFRKSALKLFLTKAFMKYGSRKISLIALSFILVISSVFLFNSWWTKRNEEVVKSILSEGRQLLFAREADPIAKSEFILVAEQLDPGFFKALVKDLPDNQQGMGIALRIPELIFSRNKYSNPHIVLTSLQLADSLMRREPIPNFSSVKAVDSYLNHWNDLLNVEFNYLYFKSNEELNEQHQHHAKTLGKFIFAFFKTADPSMKWEKKAIHNAVVNTLNFQGLSPDSLSALASFISPLEGLDPARQKFDLFFPLKETIPVGINQVIEHNGGYEILASLYASLGRVDKAMMCMDTILKYHKEYDRNFNNSRNVAAYFILNDHESDYEKFISAYAKRLDLSRVDYARGLTNRAGIFDILNFIRGVKHGNFNANLTLLSGNYLKKIFDINRSIIIEDISDPNERNLALALLTKHQAVVLAKKSRERKESVDSIRITQLFDEAYTFYKKLSEQFLEGRIEVTAMQDVESTTSIALRRRQLFIYPDHLNVVLPNFSSGGCLFYGDDFFRYLDRRNLWSSLYQTASDYDQLNKWVAFSFSFRDLYAPFTGLNGSYNNYPVSLDHSVFTVLDSLISRSGFEKEVDNSWIQIQLLHDYLAQNDTTKVITLLDRINYTRLVTGRKNFIETSGMNNFATQAATELIKAGYPNRATSFVHRFKRRENRIVTYAQLGITSYRNGQEQQAQLYLDSITMEFENTTNITGFNYNGFYDLRNGVVQLIALLKKDNGRSEILDLTGSMGFKKIEGIASWTRTFAETNQYYNAKSVIPGLANADDRLYLYSQILYKEIMRRQGAESDAWKDYDRDYNKFLNFIFYGFDNL